MPPPNSERVLRADDVWASCPPYHGCAIDTDIFCRFWHTRRPGAVTNQLCSRRRGVKASVAYKPYVCQNVRVFRPFTCSQSSLCLQQTFPPRGQRVRTSLGYYPATIGIRCWGTCEIVVFGPAKRNHPPESATRAVSAARSRYGAREQRHPRYARFPFRLLRHSRLTPLV